MLTRTRSKLTPKPRQPASLATHGDTVFVSAVIKATELFGTKVRKQALEANVSFKYATKFLAKQAVAQFRALDLSEEGNRFDKTKSRLCEDINAFIKKENSDRQDWHRSRIVLSPTELKLIHLLCEDPSHVQTDTKCVNAVLHSILLKLRVPKQ